MALLDRAERAGAADGPVHTNLGFLYQVSGQTAAARTEYAAALRENPFDASALTNRAVLDAGSGQLGEAVRLLDRLVRADSSQTRAGLDLAFLECRGGEREEARALAERLRELNPDSPEVRAFLREGKVGGQRCEALASR